jgi:hypothetical protein
LIMKNKFYRVLFIYLDSGKKVETIIDGKDFETACKRYGGENKIIKLI